MRRGILYNTFLYCLLLASGCAKINEVETSSARSSSSASGTPSYAYIYKDNPVILSGNKNLTTPQFSNYLDAEFISSDNFLRTKIPFRQSYNSTNSISTTTANYGIQVKSNDLQSTTPLQPQSNGSWTFTTESDAFYEVNTYYHVNRLMLYMERVLDLAHNLTHIGSNIYIPPSTQHNYLATYSHWAHSEGSTNLLNVYSKCPTSPINAYYLSSERELCYGYNDNDADFLMAQDPSVIYHEMGHVFVDIMMNQRNITSDFVNGLTYKEYHSSLGSIFYDEAGAINEGIADYFSYIMNTRTFIGEWGMQRFFNAGRPMSEDESIHAATISKAPGERLSYPQYLYYDANEPTTNYEDVHVAGQIVSHFLVALTEQIKNECTPVTTSNSSGFAANRFEELYSSTYTELSSYMSGITLKNVKKHVYATTLVMTLLNETLSEVGDLTSTGSDLLNPDMTFQAALNDVYWTNLHPDSSFEWAQTVRPANFRRFFQIFAKNMKHYLTLSHCSAISLDDIETLLDEYGLLLFKNYNDLGMSTDGSYAYDDFSALGLSLFSSKILTPLSTSDQVNELNRRNTVLVSKNFIGLPSSGSIGYVFDKKSVVDALIANLTFQGEPVQITDGIAGTQYNNDNIKISPGEVVGLAINLYNSSNSTISGVHVLANDWDHLKLTDNTKRYITNDENMSANSSNLSNFSPCQFSGWPLATEGGVTDSTATNGDCSYITDDAAKYDLTSNPGYSQYELDAPQPVCLVQISSANETKWVDQNYYRQSALGLEDKNCLNNPSMSGDEFNPNECLIRFLPGANQAFIGKIDPAMTWPQTLQGDSNDTPVFNSSTALLMEVNKWIQPGTIFNCRLRVNFNNCSDCFTNTTTGLDYPDKEYAGAKPFKVINFKFTVID